MGSVPCNFAGKHTLITGAGSGIGLELCKCLQERGAASVCILDLSDSALQSAADILRAHGANTAVHTFRCDVTNYEEVVQAVQTAHQKCGGLDVVFANAGIGPNGYFLEKKAAFYDKLMSVNYLGVVHTLKATLPIFVKQDSGYVMVTNSLAGFAGTRGLSGYCASKFAVRGLIESIRLELLGTGVSFYQACPNFCDTPMMRKSLAEAPPNLQAMFKATVPVLADPKEVAVKMIEGMELGRYIVRSPDHIVDLMVKGCLTPCMPRYNGMLVDVLLGPLYVWIHHTVSKKLEVAADIFMYGLPPPPEPKSTGKSLFWSILAMAALSMAAARFARLV